MKEVSNIQELQAALKVSAPGEVIRLKGGIYAGQFTCVLQGTASNPIIIEAAPGETAILTGTVPVKGEWKNYQGRIWACTLDPGLVNLIQSNLLNRDRDPALTSTGRIQLFLDWQAINEAQWPTPKKVYWEDRPENYAIAASGSLGPVVGSGRYANWYRATYTLDPQKYPDFVSLPDDAIVGSQIFFTPGNEWWIFNGIIESRQGNQINFLFPYNGTSQAVPRSGNPFHLWGNLKFLASGQFFLDEKTWTLYYWTEKNPAELGARLRIRAYWSVLDIFGSSQSQFLIFKNLNFFAGRLFIEGQDIQFDRCQFEYGTHYHQMDVQFPGIRLQGARNSIANCHISKCSGTAVSLSYRPTGENGENKVVNNTFSHVYWGSMAIEMSPKTSGNIIEQNTFTHMSGGAINFGSPKSLIKRNRVDYFGTGITTDLGAINSFNCGHLQGTTILENYVSRGMSSYSDYQYGPVCYRADGGAPEPGVSGCNFVRNIAANTEKGIGIWAQRPKHIGFGKADIKVEANTIVNCPQSIVSTNDTGESKIGTVYINNLATGSMKPGAPGATYINNLSYQPPTIFVNPQAGDYRVKAKSLAAEKAVGAIGNHLEKISWVAGAFILPEHLEKLKVAISQIQTSPTQRRIICQINNIPAGRHLPLDFQVILENGSEQILLQEFQNIWDENTFTVTGYISQDIAPDLVGVMSVKVKLASTNWLEKGTYSLTPVSETSWSQNKLPQWTRRRIEIQNPSAYTLYEYPVRLVIDTKSLVPNQRIKLNEIRFTDEDGGFLPFWLEKGWGTSETIFWVRVNYLPAKQVTSIWLCYEPRGINNLENNSNSSVVFPIFFDDCSGTEMGKFYQRLNLPAGVTLGKENGYIKLKGTSGTSGIYTQIGFVWFSWMIPFPEHFAIDCNLTVLPQKPALSPWSACLGTSGGAMRITSQAIAGKAGQFLGQITWWNGSTNLNLGTSSLESTGEENWISIGYLPEPNGTFTLLWRENGSLKAQRSGVANPDRGRFEFAPCAQNTTYEVWWRNLRVRPLSPDGNEPVMQSISEQEENWLVC